MKFHAANIILRFTTVLHTLLLITRHLPTSPGLSAFTQRGPATLQPWLSKLPPTAARPYKPHQFPLTPALLICPHQLPSTPAPPTHPPTPAFPSLPPGQVGLIPGCLMQRKSRALDLIRRAQISPQSISFRFLALLLILSQLRASTAWPFASKPGGTGSSHHSGAHGLKEDFSAFLNRSFFVFCFGCAT